MTAVVGPNGAGKSTLIKSIVGLLKPASGMVARSPSARLASLPQAADVDRTFPMTVHDMVMLGAWHVTGALRRSNPQLEQAVGEALTAVGLGAFGLRSVGALSVGQFQRVLFARLLLQDAPLIVLDEPFTAVDTRTKEDLTAILHGWHAEGRTIIAVLHDLDQVRIDFPRCLLLAREQCGWGAAAEALAPANLDRANALAEGWGDVTGL